MTQYAKACITELLCTWEATSAYRPIFHDTRLEVLHSNCSTGTKIASFSKLKVLLIQSSREREIPMRFMKLERKKKGVLTLLFCSPFLKSLPHRSGTPDQPTSGSAALHFNELICKLILMSSFKFLYRSLTSAGIAPSLLLVYNARLLTVQLVSCSSGIYLQSDISNSS